LLKKAKKHKEEIGQIFEVKPKKKIIHYHNYAYEKTKILNYILIFL